MPRRNTIDDFWALVEIRGPAECWPWLGYVQPNGYGVFKMARRRDYAHVWLHEVTIGPVPEGQHVDHECHTVACKLTDRLCPHRRCCNPSHIQAKTPAANILRGNSPLADHARKTSCPTCGDPYYVDGSGARRCRRCKNRRWRERKQERRHQAIPLADITD